MKRIHRHTGGLEIGFPLLVGHLRIHRHTGGLENLSMPQLMI